MAAWYEDLQRGFREFNYGEFGSDALTMGLSGAATGAGGGAVAGGIGAIPGTIIGGIAGLGAATSKALGKHDWTNRGTAGQQGMTNNGIGMNSQQTSLLNPEQQALQQKLLAQSNEQAGNNQFNFDPIAKEAQRRFSTETVPEITGRFGHLGAMGSSGLNAALAGAGRNLQSDLAGQEQSYNLQRLQLQQQQQKNLLNPGTQQTTGMQQAPGALQSLGQQLPKITGGLADIYSSFQKSKKEKEAEEQAAGSFIGTDNPPLSVPEGTYSPMPSGPFTPLSQRPSAQAAEPFNQFKQQVSNIPSSYGQGGIQGLQSMSGAQPTAAMQPSQAGTTQIAGITPSNYVRTLIASF